MSDARAVNIPSFMTSLCSLLAGSNCVTVPQAMWTRQPDTMVGAEPAFSFSADLAAVSATVVP